MYYGSEYEHASFESLKGKTFRKVKKDGDTIRFVTNDNEVFVMGHEQSCCEHVGIEDIYGDLSDLVGSEILMAEESTRDDPKAGEYGIGMWTFYKLATIKGYVDIRWYGSSNGYYSVSVNLYKKNISREQDNDA